MQNKGAIKVFAVAFALVCLYQLSFTFFTKNVESNAKKVAYNEETAKLAKQLANGNELKENYLYDSIGEAKENAYLDSMSNETVFNFLWLRKFSYKDCKEKEISLGLDLKGGMNVMLEVSTADVVKALANHTADSTFNKAVERAIQKHHTTGTGNFVDIFGQAVNEIDPNIKLAGYFINQLSGKIKLTDDNKTVLATVKKETEGAFDRTYQILRQRIDKFGVSNPNIQKLEASERILIELPGVKDGERVRKLLQGTAQLEFWLAADFRDVYKYMENANTFLAAVGSGITDSTNTINDTTKVQIPATDTAAKNDVLAALKETKDSGANKQSQLSSEEMEEKNPLFSKLSLNVDEKARTLNEGPVVGFAFARERKNISDMLEKAIEKKIIPSKYKFLWGAKPIKGTDFYHLYAIEVTTKDKTALLGGDVVSDAHQTFNSITGGVEISMSMNSEGTRDWKKITGSNKGKCIAIVLDNLVYSAPVVNNEIPNGQSVIQGGFTIEEGKDLANILKAGKLPAPASIVQDAVVGPSLGKESINSGITSFIIAFVLILAYMIFFYKNAGLITGAALIVNIFFLFGVLASLGSVLTLPGIAGIVLTLAMAVDANVIINERVKEELRAGKTLATAVHDGYKHAYSAIIDGNVTTLLTGVILIIFGTGPIQGFAVTLCVGLLTSLFTSIFITRLIIDYLLARKKHVSFYFSFTKNFLAHTKIDFVGMHKKFYIVLITTTVISVGAIAVKGLNYGIDFTGGRTFVVYFDKEVKTADIREALTDQFNDAPEVKTYGNNNRVKITTKYRISENSEEARKDVETRLYKGCVDLYEKPLTQAEFASTETNPLGIISSEVVGPTMANDIKRSAVIAIVLALGMIFVYLALRFNKWQYGFGGLVSLANDALVTIGAFALFSGVLPFSLEVDQSFIAAILTIIGYSINDTVIVFDRVREYVKLYPRREFKDVMNDAINSTLNRTVNTVGSVVLVLLLIFLFGGDVIRGFSFALLLGVTVGAYSSVFIACPIAYDLLMKKQRKEAKLSESKK